MGGSRFSADDWSGYSTKTAAKPAAAIFKSRSMDASLDPMNIGVRESCDSAANPNSTPLILAVDVTGSMGILAETIVKKSLGVIMGEIYDRKPVPDPHILCMAIGDSVYDSAPLQVTQFEASIVITDQIEKIWIEAGGGGNDGESYPMAWYFAAMKTKTDSMIKRGKKGFLFTIGDEPPLLKLSRADIKKFFGDDAERDYTARELLDMASQSYEVFHLIVNPGHYSADRWKDLLGERAIKITDVNKLAEVIVSTLQISTGADVDTVVKSWSGDTSLVVANAVSGLAKTAVGTGVQRL